MPRRVALSFVLLVVASGCAPRVSHHLEVPRGEPSAMEDGVRMRTASAGPVEAAVGYLRSDDRDHVLWVRITNHSDRTLVVDPADFATVAFHEADSNDGLRAPARDPVAEVAAVEREADRRKAWGTASIVLGAVVGVVTTVSTIADPPDTRREAYATEDALYTAEGLVLDGIAARRVAAYDRAVGLSYWESVLQRTTLPPNTFIDGLVHVPIAPEARVVVVEVGTERRAVPFRFRQRTARW